MALNDENLEPGDPNYGRTIIRDRKYLPDYLETPALDARPIGQIQLPAHLGVAALSATYVTFADDVTGLSLVGKHVTITVNQTTNDITDILVEDI